MGSEHLRLGVTSSSQLSGRLVVFCAGAPAGFAGMTAGLRTAAEEPVPHPAKAIAAPRVAGNKTGRQRLRRNRSTRARISCSRMNPPWSRSIREPDVIGERRSNLPMKRTKACQLSTDVQRAGAAGSSEDCRPPRGPGGATIDHRPRPSPLIGEPLIWNDPASPIISPPAVSW